MELRECIDAEEQRGEKKSFKVCCGSGIECNKDQEDEKEEKNPGHG